MSAMNDGWYVAEPDGYTVGPLSRQELEARRVRGAFPPEALAWHVDVAEWRPLATTVAVSESPAIGNANKPAPTRSAAPSHAVPASAPRDKAERKRMAKLEVAKRSSSPDTGARLLSHAAQTSAPRQQAQMPAKVDKAAAAQTGARAATAMRRFLARALDTTTLGMLGAVALWAFVQHRMPGVLGSVSEPPPVMLLLVMAVAALVPLEAIALAAAGTTPGKALLGLRVVRGENARPTPVQAWRRAVDVAWRGMAFGIPVLSFITAMVAFARLVGSGAARWDASNGLETRAAALPGARWQIALAATIGALILLSSSFWPELALQIKDGP